VHIGYAYLHDQTLSVPIELLQRELPLEYVLCLFLLHCHLADSVLCWQNSVDNN
jgi:hypothetical protein